MSRGLQEEATENTIERIETIRDDLVNLIESVLSHDGEVTGEQRERLEEMLETLTPSGRSDEDFALGSTKEDFYR